MRRGKIIKTIAAISFVFVATIFMGQNSYADVNSLYKKNLLNNMTTCYNSHFYSEVVVGSIKNSDKDLKNLEYEGFSDSLLNGKGDEFVLLPTKVKNTFDVYKKMNCKQLFQGDDKGLGTSWGDATGLFELSGVTPATSYGSNEEKKSFIRKMGYTVEEDASVVSSNRQCYNFEYDIISLVNEGSYAVGDSRLEGKLLDAGSVCWNIPSGESFRNYDVDGNLEETAPISSGWDYGERHIDVKMSTNAVGDSEGGALVHHCFTDSSLSEYDEYGAENCLSKIETYISLKDDRVDSSMQDRFNAGVGDPSFYPWVYGKKGESSSNSYDIKKLSIKDNSFNSACAEARKSAFGDSGTSDRDSAKCNNEKVTPQEKKELYDYYFRNVYGIKNAADSIECETTKPSSGYYIQVLKNGKKRWCPINGGNNIYANVTAYTDDEEYVLNTVVDLNGLLQLYNNLELSEEDLGEIEDVIVGDTDDPSANITTGNDTDDCFKVAESLGWIVCPLIKKMGEAASGLYAQVSQEFIVIDAGFFEGGDSPIRIAWNDIVGFANAIMVIFLLVVVFSQITGVGIDNYGIKKVLPKIIIAAILINLSFLICQLAVELSNILGDALNTMFTNWAKNIPLETVSGQKIEEGKGLFFGLLNAISGGMLGLGAAEGASIALTIASAESTGVAIAGAVMSIIIPLLCALIIVIVAVFFFFILLGVRKACVIVLVVISPLAFVCYMLPNTKALFQKWWNALKGMLMLYPICGLMIGGGYYVSKLITSTSGNYFVQFTALLLMVVPYFFIPKMLTNSLAAMGSIGAKISGFGKNFGRRMSKSTRDASGRLGGAIKGTNRFKDWQERSAEKRTAGIVDRLRNKQKNGELSKYQTRKLAKYQSAANESYAKNLSREAVANEMHQEAVKANLDEKFADDSVRSATSLYKNGGQYDINDVKGTGDRSMNAAYAAALADYNSNKSGDNLAKIKALQNILSGTEDGRNIIQRNLSQTAMSGNTDTAKAAASHLLSEHGGTYKAANRSLHSMVTDMANGNVAGAASQYKDGSYDRKTIDSYEAASFAAADDAAIDKMVDEYKKILNKDNKDITAKDIEFTNKMENLVYDMTKEGSHINVKGKIRDKISIIPPIQHKQ